MFNGRFKPRMDTIRTFFLQNQDTFFNFLKIEGEASPPSPPSCAPGISTQSSFTVFSFLIVSIFSFSFTQLRKSICSLVTFSNYSILCPFSIKAFVKNYISLSKYVYQIRSTCDVPYNGKTKEKAIKHQQDSFNGKWENSGPNEHCLECHGQFSWIKLKTSSYDIVWVMKEILSRQTRGIYSSSTWSKKTPTQRLDVKLTNSFDSILNMTYAWKQLWLPKSNYFKKHKSD